MTEAGTRLEAKLGFDRIRTMIADRCSTDYAAQRVTAEQFISDPATIRRRLQLTDEMRLVVMFEENFPTNGYLDCLPFLTPLQKEGSSIDLLSLGKLRTTLDTIRKITGFFRGIKDGIYPNLKRMAAPVSDLPDIRKRIDGILDRYGSIRDNASPELAQIRKTLKEKESAISKRAAAIREIPYPRPVRQQTQAARLHLRRISIRQDDLHRTGRDRRPRKRDQRAAFRRNARDRTHPAGIQRCHPARRPGPAGRSRLYRRD